MKYAPHSVVFPHAAAVMHHGGIGTTGQALRARMPQIVVPHFGDQFDNAARLRAAGLGVTIRRERFECAIGKSAISHVLSDQGMQQAARNAARTNAGEDGAAAAARRIVALVRGGC
jgi:UDP:flavonoid glycosyltransferase YjiC (YdhE family)